MQAEIKNVKQMVMRGAFIAVAKKPPVRKSEWTVEENNAIVRAIELLAKAFRATPSQNFYGRLPLRKAVFERLQTDGEEETHRVLRAFIVGIEMKDSFRPTFSTPHVMMTSGWSKAVAFADRQERQDGKVKIANSEILDEIIGGLSTGGAR